MKKLLAALFVSAAFAGAPSFAMAQATAPAAAATPTAAVDPQTTAAVKQMLDAMEVRKMMTASFAEMQKALPQMMRAQVGAVINADTSMDAAKKQEALAKVEQILPGAVDAVAKVFRDPALIDEMMAEMVPLYANNYTTAEIKELTRFYGTPLGRKMLALTPRLSAESMAIGQRIVTPRLNNLMQDIMQAAAQAK
ncbi:DUF2059 domain-containing protein [Massilia sp. YIM B02443]|uniref:DUF2059 domain-containing protein n=1 Tax=Massilia sp. YIM B02443 TaxID=3050127 RepID=UPI0025B6319E|nr:DUF2059 domain-containing protein [Massilia sp. YIM B02443]MDN4036710.1 DUF2059 domain-containing protein [Massilia sp. YIM B02443]